MKLHPSYIADLQSLAPLDNLWMRSSVPMFIDTACTLPVDNPCSLEVITLADIRFKDPPTLTISDKSGNEVYVSQPVLVEDSFASSTPATPATNWNELVGKPSSFTPSAHNQDWSTITTGKPTTIAGYGITDAFTQTLADARYPQLSVQYTNPTWLAGIDASIVKTGTIDLARLPALPSANTIVCTTIPAMTAGDQALVAKGTVVIESTTGNTYRYSGSGSVVLNASYIQQSDLTPDWAVITNKPTLISTWTNDSGYLTPAIYGTINTWTAKQNFADTSAYGYGSYTLWGNSGSDRVIDVRKKTDTNARIALYENGTLLFGNGAGGTLGTLVGVTAGLSTPGDLTVGGTLISTYCAQFTSAWIGTNSADNAVDTVGLRNSAIASAVAGYSPTSHTHTFASLTSKPTTLSGYGITDAASSSHTHTFASLTSKPTTLSGYGITDAMSSSYIPAWSTITGKPTTLAGYGITDAVSSSDSRLTDTRTPTNQAWYVYGDNGTGSRALTDFNAIVKSGFGSGASATGSPTTGWYHIITNKYAGDTTGWLFQIAAGFGTTASPAAAEGYYVRIKEGTSAPTAWRKLWHDGNLTGDQGTTHTHSQYLTTATASSTYATKATTLAGYGITDAATSGHTHTYINASYGNETIIANGYATTGNLWINYRGATSAITTYIFCNGLTNGGKASIDALNGVFSGTVTATGAISGGSFSTAGSIAVNGYTITGTKINDWDNASALRHSHSNITNLNNINQNLSTADRPSWIGASIGKGSTIGNYNILTFNTERSWAFTKTGDGASTGLNLVELSGQKNFNIGYSSDGLNVTALAFNILTNQTQSSNQINSWGTWTHTGTLSASDIYSGNAFIGTHTVHTAWAEFCHQNMKGSSTGYNVLCLSDGTLNLNAPSGKAINFSNNNGASIATFDSTGFKVNGALVTSGLIGQWNTAWSRIAQGRLCEDAYTGEDTLDWITRMGRGNHWGRINGVQSAPSYYNYMLIRETTGTKYSVIGCSADGNWYVGSCASNANLTTYNKIWTNADFSSTAVARINNSDNNYGFSRLYRSDDQSKYYLRHGWTTGKWYGSAWRMTCANDLGDDQTGIYTVAVDYSSTSLKSYSLIDSGQYKSNLDTGFKDNSFGLWAGSIDAPTGTTPFGSSWTWLQEWGHSDGNWRAQLATPYFSDNLAYRRKANGTWQPWRYVVSTDASGNLPSLKVPGGQTLTIDGSLLCNNTVSYTVTGSDLTGAGPYNIGDYSRNVVACPVATTIQLQTSTYSYFKIIHAIGGTVAVTAVGGATIKRGSGGSNTTYNIGAGGTAICGYTPGMGFWLGWLY